MSEPYLGEIRMFGGTFAPRGWALCDGQLIAIESNQALFSLLGTAYGGDGNTTFALPDMRGRIPIKNGTGPGLSPRNLGSKGGTEQETLTIQHLPSHRHKQNASSSPAGRSDPSDALPANGDLPSYAAIGGGAVNMASDTIGHSGGGQPHNNLQPFLCINFIIALVGIFPPRP